MDNSSPVGRSPADLLAGRHVWLRPVDTADYAFLRAMELNGALRTRWRHRGATPAPEAFPQRLWQNVLAQFLVQPNDRARPPLGILLLYNATFVDGHAYVAFAKFDPADRSPLFVEGAALFMDYVFNTWPLRKVYAEASDLTLAQFRVGARELFVTEGVLREHVFIEGALHDSHILACWKGTWEEIGKPYAEWARKTPHVS